MHNEKNAETQSSADTAVAKEQDRQRRDLAKAKGEPVPETLPAETRAGTAKPK